MGAQEMVNKKLQMEGGFIQVPYNLIDSLAYQHLPPRATQVLILLVRRFNGFNNGEISLSCREISKLTGMSKNTARNSLEALELHGIIKTVKKGHFQNRHASTFVLTFLKPSINIKMFARDKTDDWKRYCPKQKKVPEIELKVSPMDT